MKARQFGQAAEDLAVTHLQSLGFSITARNYRHQRAEIDIIAQKQGLLVFVEVKARSSAHFGYPEAFVTPKQQSLIYTAAEEYIMTNNWEEAIRFDIIAVSHDHGKTELTYFEDAF